MTDDDFPNRPSHEGGKISSELRRQIEHWFIDTVTSTFSIFSGESWALDLDRAQSTFDSVVAA